VTAPVLQVQDLHFAYPGQPPLFKGLSFTLPGGLVRLDAERGKTTLLKLLAGTLRAPRGRFVLNGQPWDPALQPRDVCHLDPRDPAWDPLTPDQLLDRVRTRHPQLDGAAWHALLTDFDLQQHRHKTLHMLSTGSRRKVALAASLAAGATLTLLDEPTAGLDRPALDRLVQALADSAPGPGRVTLLAAAWGLEQHLPWAALLDF